MTDTTIPAVPDVTADPVWRRLVMDAAAFQRVYDTPAHLATLVQQAIAAGAAIGWRDALSHAAGPRLSAPAKLVAEVLDDAAHRPGDPAVAALHAFAHAGQRARAGQHARVETDSTTTDGGNCGG